MPRLFLWALVACGTPALWADANCAARLESPRSLIDRTVSLDNAIVALLPATNEVPALRSIFANLQNELLELLPGIDTSPQQAGARLRTLGVKVESLRLFVTSAANGFDDLKIYEGHPELLTADRVYFSGRAQTVRLAPEVLKNWSDDAELARQSLRAVNQGSMTRLRANPGVWEIRLRSRQYGNYRLYGAMEEGVLNIRSLIARHNRPKDIANVLNKFN